MYHFVNYFRSDKFRFNGSIIDHDNPTWYVPTPENDNLSILKRKIGRNVCE